MMIIYLLLFQKNYYMALINNKNHEMCLHYANNLTFKEILKQHKYFVKKFEQLKYRKHSFQGKTTKHRKGKEEQYLAQYRNAVQLGNLIIFYKKQIKLNKIIVQSNNNIKIKSLYNFLKGNK